MPRFRVPDYIRTTFAVSDWRGFRLCGMDEVGRGAYAGRLVAAAVVLPQRFRHPLLRDSKLLTAKQRETVAEVVRRRAVGWMVAEISAPTLLICGDEDPSLQPMRVMEKKIKQARFVLLSPAGHFANRDQPEAFNRAVLEFLDEIGPA